MKKLISILLSGALFLSLTACGGDSASSDARQGSGTINQSSTVDQILEAGVKAAEEAAVLETPAPTVAAEEPAVTPAEESVSAAVETAPVSVAELNTDPSTTHAPEETALAVGDLPESDVDVDLTKLSSTLVYSEVYNMMDMPGSYEGKTIRMEGLCNSYYFPPTDTTYYSVIIPDATACCAQGLEYLLADGEYPVDGREVTVTGEFEVYYEGDYRYCRLANARLGV